MKLRIVYFKSGLIRFISHRDLMRLIFRAVIRAGLSVEFSRGFNPHPRVEFCPPLSVGMEGMNEIADLRQENRMELAAAASGLAGQLPAGIGLVDLFYPLTGSPSLGRSLATASYRAFQPGPARSPTWAPSRSISEGGGAISVRSRAGGLEYDLVIPVSDSPRKVLAALVPETADPSRPPLWTRLCFHGSGVYRRPPAIPPSAVI